MSNGKKTYSFYEGLAKLQVKGKQGYANKLKDMYKEQGKENGKKS